jgi:hypothetical protein
MKIRNGFVSNSSSSSFLIYGVTIEGVEGMTEEILYGVFSSDCDLEVIHPDSYYPFYVGRSFDSMKMDETRRQFQANIESEILSRLGTQIKAEHVSEFRVLSESWYNG